jgi:Calcineurin-like phosphoesterase
VKQGHGRRSFASFASFAALAIRASAAIALALLAPRPLPVAAASACEWNGVDRVVAVGDVHGAYDRFVDILKAAGLVDAAGHWTGGSTHLVQLGDVLDRGNDSRKALDLLRQLEREAPMAGGKVHPLLGNHELMRMMGDLRFTIPGEYAAFARADSESTRSSYLNSPRPAVDRDQVEKMPLGFLEMRVAFGRDGEYGRWLRQLPVTITIDGFVFVHGGISQAFAAIGCDAINDRMRRELTTDLDKTRAKPLESLAGRADGPLWYRGLAQEPDAFAPQVDDIIAKLHARAIVVGHTVTTPGRVTARFDGRVIQIDTGMNPTYVPDGKASALEIRGEEVTAIYADRREPINVPTRVRPSQAGVIGNRRSGSR